MRSLFLFALLPLVACSGNAASGAPGPKTTRSFALTGFDKVESRGSENVRVTTGAAFAIRAEGDQAVIDRLEPVVENGRLVIRQKDGNFNWGRGTRGNATVFVTMPRIVAAAIEGSGNMTIDRGEGDFDASIAGSGDMAIGRIDGGRVALSIAGSGEMAVTGMAQALNADIAGSGSINARELTARSASVSIAGSGDVLANVRGNAVVSLVGSGSADLGSGARCTVSKVGSGSATCGRR